MKCLVCDCIFPASYEKCPVCGNYAITREQFAPQVVEVEEKEPITSMVVQAEIEEVDE